MTVVLAPKRKTYADLGDWNIVRGRKAHDAIVDVHVREEELAQRLSRGAKQPTYVLSCDEEYPRVQVFARGRYAGDIHASPDRVARQLGCTFPTCDGGRGAVDLTPHKAPDRKTGEQTILRWTVRQWKHMIAHEPGQWSILLDGAGAAEATRVLPLLDDKRADARAVACELLGAIGYLGEKSEFGLGKLAAGTLARLRALATNDPDPRVRAAAKRRADDLASSIEMHAVRAEFPWIEKHGANAHDEALAALDDPREAVRAEVLWWWGSAWEVPQPIGKKAEQKLVALLAGASEDTRYSIESALANVRRKTGG
jgi:hypothetical protein